MPESPPRARHAARDAEAIVVGGGPAGSTIAAALTEAGHRVILLDKARFPRHKACSDYINPGAVAILRQLGVLDELIRAGAHRTEGMLIHAPSGSRFLVDFPRAESGREALGLTRYRLDHLLFDRARSAGTTIMEGAHVRQVIREAGQASGVVATIEGERRELRASIVIGADGRHSIVARQLGVAVPIRWPRRTGLMAHFRGARGLDRHGELHVMPGGYGGLAPLEDGLTNVALVTGTDAVAHRDGALDDYFTGAIARMPLMAARLMDAQRVGPIRGVGPLAHRVRQVCGDGFLLVGDAAGFLDPFTGDGIAQALRSAQVAAPIVSRALRAGDTSARALAPYRAARRRAFAAKRGVSWIVQGFIHVPPLIDYAAARLERRDTLALILTGVVGDFRPARDALSPLFLARLLRP